MRNLLVGLSLLLSVWTATAQNFTIHALKTPSLPLTKEANPAMVRFYINANTLQKASLVMYYQRDNE